MMAVFVLWLSDNIEHANQDFIDKPSHFPCKILMTAPSILVEMEDLAQMASIATHVHVLQGLLVSAVRKVSKEE